jgi:hypothetical protein
VLANGITESSQFGVKTDRNYVFLSIDAHITDC